MVTNNQRSCPILKYYFRIFVKLTKKDIYRVSGDFMSIPQVHIPEAPPSQIWHMNARFSPVMGIMGIWVASCADIFIGRPAHQ